MRVKLLYATRRVLAALVVAGLIMAPLARPTVAMASHERAATGDPGAMAGQMAMAAAMPCCPDEAPASDCGKDCPLMALCMASVLQSAPLGAALFIPLTLAGIVVPDNDADLGSLAQAPPPKPPKA